MPNKNATEGMSKEEVMSHINDFISSFDQDNEKLVVIKWNPETASVKFGVYATNTALNELLGVLDFISNLIEKNYRDEDLEDEEIDEETELAYKLLN